MAIDINKIQCDDVVELGQSLTGVVYEISYDTQSLLVDFEQSNQPKSWVTISNPFLVRVGCQRITGVVNVVD